MVTDLPKYMNDVLRFPLSQNGLYSALPYLFMWIVSVSTGFLSDWLIVKEYLNITNARKVFTAVGKLTYIIKLNFYQMNDLENTFFLNNRCCFPRLFYYWCILCRL